MKTLTVRFVGPVRRPGPERTLEVDPRPLASVADLLQHLGYEEQEQSSITVLLDGARANLGDPVDEARAARAGR